MFEYFVFSVPSLEDTDFNITEHDSENTAWIKNQDAKLFNDAQKEDKLIVYNREDKKFYKNNKEINVKGLRVFPKCFIFLAEELINALVENGAESIMTMEDYHKTEHWPNYFQPTHRPVDLLTYGEFKKNYKHYQETMPELFFKTVIKGTRVLNLKYGAIEIGDQSYFFTKPPFFHIEDEDEVMVSPMFEVIEDPDNEASDREYRAFIIDNQIYSISRSYVDWPTKVPEEVLKYVRKKVEEISKTDFVNNYVLDVTECVINGEKVVDVIEANPISCSGLEVCHDLLHPIDTFNYRKK